MTRMLQQQEFIVKKIFGVSFRMNGLFWARLCYWLPRMFGYRSKETYTKMELCLGRKLPGLSPGLFFICRNPENDGELKQVIPQ
jgi:hypothetical protein